MNTRTNNEPESPDRGHGLWREDFFSAYQSMKKRYATALNRIRTLEILEPAEALKLARYYIDQMNSIAEDPEIVSTAQNRDQQSQTGT